jgi:uncharacterized protein (TIRG00374 family)
MTTNSTRRYWSLLLIRSLITLAVSAGLIYQIDLYRTLIQWQDAEWRYLILLGFPVSLACLLINVVRWHLILTHQGLRPAFLNVTVICTKAAFLGSVLPGGMVTGDVYRVHLLTKTTQNLDASIRSVLLDKVSGLFGLLVIALAGLLGYWFETSNDSFRPLLIPFSVVVSSCLGAIVGVLLVRGGCFERANWQHPLLLRVRSFLEMVLKCLEDKPLMLKQLTLCLALQLVIVGWTYIVSMALHFSVSFVALSIATPLAALVSLLPISLGGVGVREAGYVLFLVPFGLTVGEATSLSLVSGLIQSGLRLVFGLIFLWDPARVSMTESLEPRPSEANSADRL